LQKLIAQATIRRQGLRQMPVALPAEARENCVIPWCTESDQFTDAAARPAPLFPVAHPNATPEPMIHFYGIVMLQGDTEVVHPALNVGTDFSIPPLARTFGSIL
jgi:hypothetical protein